MPHSGETVAIARRSAALDGLRGLAAIAVVTSHLTANVGVVPYSSGGFVGVLVFFALSGYLITGILWRGPATSAHYRSFLWRRVKRLAPVVTVLAATGIPLLLLVGGESAAFTLGQAALTLSQTTGFAFGSGVAIHPLWSPTWSLTVEWVFYLVFPLVLSALRARGLTPRAIRGVLAVLVVALYIAGLLLSPRAFYLLPVANVSVMLAGAVLAITHATQSAPGGRPDPARAAAALVLLVLLVLVPLAPLSPAYRFIVFPAATIAALLVINEVRHTGWLGAALGHRSLTLVGRSAYSLYLWHVPVMWLTYMAVPQLPRPLIGLLSLIALVPVVMISYWLLERPVLNRGGSAKPTVTAASETVTATVTTSRAVS
ncbi:acyltransferase [Phycicoccus sp. Root101]|uniref:acyltransferase family protein n=1 Tax=Phycicoccus sp. Root101 TaxID=1736421 RepID=UPI00070290B5|nr:acyltransferase [Phycicoccus sp. Root101]KQU69445.1 hypothetical protein ASC58_06080 [Phycicoccus sp. Root101]